MVCVTVLLSSEFLIEIHTTLKHWSNTKNKIYRSYLRNIIEKNVWNLNIYNF